MYLVENKIKVNVNDMAWNIINSDLKIVLILLFFLEGGGGEMLSLAVNEWMKENSIEEKYTLFLKSLLPS